MTSLLHPVLPRLLAALARRPVARAARSGALPSVVSPVWTLPAGQACTVVLRRGQALQVHQGRVWLTTPGQAEDHFVEPGRPHAVATRTVCVLQGCGALPARFSVGRVR